MRNTLRKLSVFCRLPSTIALCGQRKCGHDHPRLGMSLTHILCVPRKLPANTNQPTNHQRYMYPTSLFFDRRQSVVVFDMTSRTWTSVLSGESERANARKRKRLSVRTVSLVVQREICRCRCQSHTLPVPIPSFLFFFYFDMKIKEPN